MKKYLIAGNWKMNLLQAETANLISQIKEGIQNKKIDDVDILICPPFTNLSIANKAIENSPIILGAQNMHFMPKGAFTGEISPEMLLDSGCRYVILGHSERRQYFKEDNELLIKKLQAAFDNNLIPILCIGETLEERQNNKTFEVLYNQITIIHNFSREQLTKLVIAYEPVWAIGTGLTASTEQIKEVHQWIADHIYAHFALQIPILYGGSMNDKNAKEILSTENVNGGLIGGASLKSEQFLKIIDAAIEIVGN
jgi:triosephosphate isomerase